MIENAINADWLLTPGELPQPQMGIVLDNQTRKIRSLTNIEKTSQVKGTTFLTPGLINAHSHLELHADVPIVIGSGETIADWILKVVAQNRDWSHADRIANCQAGVLEMIRTGTTCANDITSTGASLEVLSQVGMRGIVSPECFYPFHTDTPDIAKICETYNGLHLQYGTDPLLTLGLSPHSTYNVTPQAWQALMTALNPELIHTHMAETEIERQWFETGASALDQIHEKLLGRRFGPASAVPTTGLQSVQASLSSRWLIAHGVYLSSEDIVLMSQQGVSLVTCPRSNLHISGKTLPNYQALQQAGIAIGLGTDSRFSTANLDMRAEGRVAQSAFGLTDAEVFELMTSGSAKAIKRGHDLGRLEPGYQGDMVLWHHPDSNITNPYAAWLSPETQALTVWVAGRIVMERDVPELWASVD